MQRVNTCPICGGGDLLPFALNAWPPDALHFAQTRCGKCGLLISQPQATEQEADSYYSSIYYEKFWEDADALWDQNTRDYASYELPLMRKLWADWPPPSHARVAEIGCGYGIFLGLLRDSGCRVTGCEISGRAATYCRHKGLEVVRGKSPHLPLQNRAFDLAVSRHVIEHVHAPRMFVKEFVELVQPGGVIVIVTEDARNAQYAWDQSARPSRWTLVSIPVFNRPHICI